MAKQNTKRIRINAEGKFDKLIDSLIFTMREKYGYELTTAQVCDKIGLDIETSKFYGTELMKPKR